LRIGRRLETGRRSESYIYMIKWWVLYTLSSLRLITRMFLIHHIPCMLGWGSIKHQ
jgi:hypothetical protein